MKQFNIEKTLHELIEMGYVEENVNGDVRALKDIDASLTEMQTEMMKIIFSYPFDNPPPVPDWVK